MLQLSIAISSCYDPYDEKDHNIPHIQVHYELNRMPHTFYGGISIQFFINDKPRLVALTIRTKVDKIGFRLSSDYL